MVRTVAARLHQAKVLTLADLRQRMPAHLLTHATDPGLLSINDWFDGLRHPNATTQRLQEGALWLGHWPGTGGARAGNWLGRLLFRSDFPNQRPISRRQDNGHVSLMRF